MAKGIMYVDNIRVEFDDEPTIMDVCRKAGVEMPNFCFHSDLSVYGACRMCVVEVKGAKSLVASCVYPVSEGMEVFTNTEKVQHSRRLTLELILSNHRMDCLTCSRNSHCELRQLASDLGIDAVRYVPDNLLPRIEDSAPHLVRDNSKCVLCRRCVAVCNKVQSVGVIGPVKRGFKTQILPAWNMGLAETGCINCGQCIAVCPTGALTEKDDTAAESLRRCRPETPDRTPAWASRPGRRYS